MTVRITHIGGPTALIEVGEWRLLTDPTFDPPRPPLHLRLGLQLPKLTGPAITPADLGPIDAVLLSHDPAATTSIPPAAPCSRRPVWSSPPPPGPTGSGATPRPQPWATTQLEAPAKPPIQVTATPCRHGPAALSSAR
jgi:hypothetical protein